MQSRCSSVHILIHFHLIMANFRQIQQSTRISKTLHADMKKIIMHAVPELQIVSVSFLSCQWWRVETNSVGPWPAGQFALSSLTLLLKYVGRWRL